MLNFNFFLIFSWEICGRLSHNTSFWTHINITSSSSRHLPAATTARTLTSTLTSTILCDGNITTIQFSVIQLLHSILHVWWRRKLHHPVTHTNTHTGSALLATTVKCQQFQQLSMATDNNCLPHCPRQTVAHKTLLFAQGQGKCDGRWSNFWPPMAMLYDQSTINLTTAREEQMIFVLLSQHQMVVSSINFKTWEQIRSMLNCL